MTATDGALKSDVLARALDAARDEGFSDAVLVRAGNDAGIGADTLSRLFPDGPASLVALFSEAADDAMEAALDKDALAAMKIRERIRAALLARLDAVRAHKDAARRAAAFLMMPAHAALGAGLMFRTVDLMWRLAGDGATDFNWYTKRAILAGVYSSTMMRWFNDPHTDESATHAFLDARIDNVMRFEKFKAEMRERTRDWPGLADVIAGFNRRNTP